MDFQDRSKCAIVFFKVFCMPTFIVFLMLKMCGYSYRMGNLSNQNTFNQCFMVVLKLRSAIYLKIY